MCVLRAAAEKPPASTTSIKPRILVNSPKSFTPSRNDVPESCFLFKKTWRLTFNSRNICLLKMAGFPEEKLLFFVIGATGFFIANNTMFNIATGLNKIARKAKKNIERLVHCAYMHLCPKSHVPVGVRRSSNGEKNRYGTWT